MYSSYGAYNTLSLNEKDQHQLTASLLDPASFPHISHAARAPARTSSELSADEHSEMSEEAQWSAQQWNWHPFNMTATPAGSKAPNTRSKTQHAAGSGSMGSFAGLASPPEADGGLGRLSVKPKGPPTCQVEGCNADLTALKEYHQRYKICEEHLKVQQIVREGVKQRFCQQCGRFHLLGEFDGDKRSCRARLQRHNARRRKKAEPEKPAKKASVPRKSSRDNLRALPQEAPAPRSRSDRKAAVAASSAGGSDAAGEREVPSGRRSAAAISREALHAGAAAAGKDWTQQPLAELALEGAFGALTGAARVGAAGFDSLQDMVGVEEHQVAKVRSDSLRDSGLSERLAMREMFVEDGLSDNRSSLAATGSAPYTSPFSATEQQAGFDQDMSEAALQPELSGTLAYPYAAMGAMAYGQQPTGKELAHLGMQDLQMEMPGYSDLSAYSGYNPAALYGVPGMSAGALLPQVPLNTGAVPTASSDMSVLDEARSLLMYTAPQAQYVPEEQFTRMSAKLFNCTPAHLPPDLKQNLVGLLSCGVNSIEGYIRPGCVHLTLNALMERNSVASLAGLGVRAAVERLLAGGASEFWSTETVLIQLADEVALVKNGQVLHVLSGVGSKGVFPSVDRVAPQVLLSAQPAPVTVTGCNLTGDDTSLLCRCQGFYTEAKVEAVEPRPVEAAGQAAGEPMAQQVRLRLPAGLRAGALQVEVMRGGFMSKPKPVMVLPCRRAVAELSRYAAQARGDLVDALLNDLDRVLEYLNTTTILAANSQEPVRTYAPADVAAVAHTARRILVFAAQFGWAGVAGLVLRAAEADCSTGEEVVAALARLTDAAPLRLSTLHLAVRSSNVDLVEMLLEWVAELGYNWRADVAGPRGLTALHLAALIDDGGAMVDALLDLCDGAAEAWETATCEDGFTPADFAAQAGLKAVLEVAKGRVNMAQEPVEEVEEADADEDEDEQYLGCADEPASAKGKVAAGAEAAKELALLNAGKLSPAPSAPAPGTPPRISALSNGEVLPAGSVPQEAAPERLYTAGSSSSSGSSSASASSSACLPQPFQEAAATPFSSSVRQRKPSKGGDASASNDTCGLHALEPQLSKGKAVYDDYYVDCELYGVKVAPTVFDQASAFASAGLIGAVGSVTLFLRYYVDYFMD